MSAGRNGTGVISHAASATRSKYASATTRLRLYQKGDGRKGRSGNGSSGNGSSDAGGGAAALTARNSSCNGSAAADSASAAASNYLRKGDLESIHADTAASTDGMPTRLPRDRLRRFVTIHPAPRRDGKLPSRSVRDDVSEHLHGEPSQQQTAGQQWRRRRERRWFLWRITMLRRESAANITIGSSSTHAQPLEVPIKVSDVFQSVIDSQPVLRGKCRRLAIEDFDARVSIINSSLSSRSRKVTFFHPGTAKYSQRKGADGMPVWVDGVQAAPIRYSGLHGNSADVRTRFSASRTRFSASQARTAAVAAHTTACCSHIPHLKPRLSPLTLPPDGRPAPLSPVFAKHLHVPVPVHVLVVSFDCWTPVLHLTGRP